MELEKDSICLPNSKTHNCFGCSPINPSGLQMEFYANDSFVFSEVTVPQHLCGWNNLIHGGVLSTILDERASVEQRRHNMHSINGKFCHIFPCSRKTPEDRDRRAFDLV